MLLNLIQDVYCPERASRLVPVALSGVSRLLYAVVPRLK